MGTKHRIKKEDITVTKYWCGYLHEYRLPDGTLFKMLYDGYTKSERTILFENAIKDKLGI